MPPRIPPPLRAASLPLSAITRPLLLRLQPQSHGQSASYSTPAGDDASAEGPNQRPSTKGDDASKLGRYPHRVHRLQKRNRIRHWLQKQGPGFKWAGAKDVRPFRFLPNAQKNEDQPFPLNPEFRAQPVLSEDAREDIWSRFFEKQEGIKAISVALNVDQRRVAAVVRMKEVEKRWLAEVCIPFFPPVLPPRARCLPNAGGSRLGRR